MRKHLAVSIAVAAVLGAFGLAHAQTDSTTRADSDTQSSSDAAPDSNASSGASWDRNTVVDASD